jgi:hypothetical protein
LDENRVSLLALARLEEIAREHEISKTTWKHVKNLHSGIFRHAAPQG